MTTGSSGMSGGELINPQEYATALANEAFNNGWINLDDLDRRLAAIANAQSPETALAVVRDLETPHQRSLVQQSVESAEARRRRRLRFAMKIPLYFSLLALVLNVIIWVLVGISTTDFPYFWPMWLLIPVVACGAIAYGGELYFKEEE